ncbi:hypothetical protein E1292_24835 [Nonomuraea deserti]|uniref:Uncharacterized protein n=1 Tax=Nonomuraea deserti TaxID=1848322 RepID=A0A4R4VE75_9ACTN|nr:hypothetical protein [Nonomuraea deserti]TDD01897.1 hypothetical protein E1292_24835 [Nonomuraea deserti]
MIRVEAATPAHALAIGMRSQSDEIVDVHHDRSAWAVRPDHTSRVTAVPHRLQVNMTTTRAWRESRRPVREVTTATVRIQQARTAARSGRAGLVDELRALTR